VTTQNAPIIFTDNAAIMLIVNAGQQLLTSS